jgi:hypothetical protein
LSKLPSHSRVDIKRVLKGCKLDEVRALLSTVYMMRYPDKWLSKLVNHILRICPDDEMLSDAIWYAGLGCYTVEDTAEVRNREKEQRKRRAYKEKRWEKISDLIDSGDIRAAARYAKESRKEDDE